MRAASRDLRVIERFSMEWVTRVGQVALPGASRGGPVASLTSVDQCYPGRPGGASAFCDAAQQTFRKSAAPGGRPRTRIPSRGPGRSRDRPASRYWPSFRMNERNDPSRPRFSSARLRLGRSLVHGVLRLGLRPGCRRRGGALVERGALDELDPIAGPADEVLGELLHGLVVELERHQLEDVDREVADVLRHDLQPAGLVVALELGLDPEVALHLEDLVGDDLALVPVLLALVLDVELPEDVPELLHVVRALLDREHLLGGGSAPPGAPRRSSPCR